MERIAPIPAGWQGATLAGKAVLIIEDEALIAFNVETCLLDAGAADVTICNSIAAAQSVLDEGIPFDAAIVDLYLRDGNTSHLFQVLAKRVIPVVITTGDADCEGQHDLSTAIEILQKPYTNSKLLSALTKCVAAAPSIPAIK